jgi:hypothetical protein
VAREVPSPHGRGEMLALPLASSFSVRRFRERRAALEHLVDVVGLVVAQVFHREVNVVRRRSPGSLA